MRTKTLQEIKLTGLDNCYLCIYTIITPINYKRDNFISMKNQYTFIGLNAIGIKRFIDSYIEDSSNNRFWLDIFESFKKSGIIDILFMAINENKNLFKWLKVAFPNVITVPSIVDTADNFYKYFSDKFLTIIIQNYKVLTLTFF
ncbi:MAG: transposase [Bacilli bacterium]